MCTAPHPWQFGSKASEDPDSLADMLADVPHTMRAAAIQYALSNSFGFGGTNGALLFKRYEA